MHPIDFAAHSPLAAQALVNLAGDFAAHNHRPSGDQWAALGALAETLEDMADGVAPPKFFLSSLDPGVGKSQTLVKFIDTLLASAAHEHVGVLLCVSRLSEVKRMVRDSGIPVDMLHVLTSDPDLNGLGKAAADDARVLITTQAMVESRLAARPFAECGLFTFRGLPRAVRVWDEAFLPGQPITLAADDLAYVFRRLTMLSPALRDEIKAIFDAIDKLPCGSVYVVPDFASQHGVSLNDALAVSGAGNEDERVALSSLWFISGKRVSIRRDGKFGGALIDYRETLPADLAPMVILDASGRVRSTYGDMEKERGLEHLRRATKDYSPLTVHVWQRGGGKSAFAEGGDTLAAGIAKTIDTRPTEEWLVVVHKRSGRVGDVKANVLRLLSATPESRVKFIHWGNHAATNEYADVPNVILAGTLFYRGSYYEALKRLAARRPAARGTVTRDELEAVQIGEHAHLILQALCRGAVRKCDGDKCHPANAYIIASVRSGIPAALPAIFPGCRVAAWSPIPRKLNGDAEAAYQFVEAWARSQRPGAVLKFRDIQRELGIDRKVFADTIRRGMPFREAIAELGVVEWGEGKYSTGYQLIGPAPQMSEVS
jgi:hypothetical protein